jgi:hypothetical protein
MFGKKLGEYILFLRWILALIAVVFVSRLAVGLAGSSFSQTRWISINIVLLLGLVYCSVAVHTSGFGSYKQLLGLLIVQTVFAHLLIASGILLGMVTGTPNIYTTPEVSGGGDGATLIHVVAHGLAGPLLAVITWPIGSLILFVTKKV